ncbi:MAG: glycosyltransferase 61 family protein [Nocardioides sp.]
MDVLTGLVPGDAGSPSPRIVVLAGPGGPPTDVLTALPPRADVVAIDVLHPDRLHVRLAALAPVDLVVDAGGEGAPDRLAHLLGHVRPGGAYACVLPDPADPDDPADPADPAVTEWVERLTALRVALTSGEQEVPPRKAKKRRALATLALAARVRLEGRVLVAVNEVAMLAKLHDTEMDDVLRERGGPDQTVVSLPAASWHSRATVRVSRRPPLNDLPTTYAAPALSLREYHQAVCLPRQAAYAGTFVLPESFRDNLQPRLQNPALEDWTARFVRRPEDPPGSLAGSWFHLDTHLAGHFGHAVTEQVAHLWGWHEAKRRDPSLRALVFAPPETPGAPLPAWNADLLEAGGVPREDVHVATGPVRVERLLAATSAYNIGRYAHPVMAETWGRIGAHLDPSGSGGSGPDRVFLTRGGDKRVCRNRAEVEALVAGSGFVVVSPERLPLAEQVRLVRGASVVAGFAGSAMFHTAFAAGPQHVVVITTETYPAHNEHAIAALLGHRLDLVVCPPDVPRRDPDRFTLESFHSDYVVGLDGPDGDFLRAALAPYSAT